MNQVLYKEIDEIFQEFFKLLHCARGQAPDHWNVIIRAVIIKLVGRLCNHLSALQITSLLGERFCVL